MDRRRYLALSTAALAGVAGCSDALDGGGAGGGDAEDDEDDSGDQSTPEETVQDVPAWRQWVPARLVGPDASVVAIDTDRLDRLPEDIASRFTVDDITTTYGISASAMDYGVVLVTGTGGLNVAFLGEYDPESIRDHLGDRVEEESTYRGYDIINEQVLLGEDVIALSSTVETLVDTRLGDVAYLGADGGDWADLLGEIHRDTVVYGVDGTFDFTPSIDAERSGYGMNPSEEGVSVTFYYYFASESDAESQLDTVSSAVEGSGDRTIESVRQEGNRIVVEGTGSGTVTDGEDVL